jgi:hypothetical protein
MLFSLRMVRFYWDDHVLRVPREWSAWWGNILVLGVLLASSPLWFMKDGNTSIINF